jgi:hypothetical protein
MSEPLGPYGVGRRTLCRTGFLGRFPPCNRDRLGRAPRGGALISAPNEKTAVVPADLMPPPPRVRVPALPLRHGEPTAFIGVAVSSSMAEVRRYRRLRHGHLLGSSQQKRSPSWSTVARLSHAPGRASVSDPSTDSVAADETPKRWAVRRCLTSAYAPTPPVGAAMSTTAASASGHMEVVVRPDL